MHVAEITDEVRCAVPSKTAASFQRFRMSSLPVPEVAARLWHAIEAAGLVVLCGVNQQAQLRRGGYAIRPAQQILFFHSDLAARLVKADLAALLEMPLKFGVLELEDGDVMVRWTDPGPALARYGNSALTEIGWQLATACENIVSAALGPRAVRSDSFSPARQVEDGVDHGGRRSARPAFGARMVSAFVTEPEFQPGDRVRISMRTSCDQRRMPFYLLGKRGTVEELIGADGDRDAASCAYRVAIPMTEIWPDYEGSLGDGLRLEIVGSCLAAV